MTLFVSLIVTVFAWGSSYLSCVWQFDPDFQTPLILDESFDFSDSEESRFAGALSDGLLAKSEPILSMSAFQKPPQAALLGKFTYRKGLCPGEECGLIPGFLMIDYGATRSVHDDASAYSSYSQTPYVNTHRSFHLLWETRQAKSPIAFHIWLTGTMPVHTVTLDLLCWVVKVARFQRSFRILPRGAARVQESLYRSSPPTTFTVRPERMSLWFLAAGNPNVSPICSTCRGRRSSMLYQRTLHLSCPPVLPRLRCLCR